MGRGPTRLPAQETTELGRPKRERCLELSLGKGGSVGQSAGDGKRR